MSFGSAACTLFVVCFGSGLFQGLGLRVFFCQGFWCLLRDSASSCFRLSVNSSGVYVSLLAVSPGVSRSC